MLPCCPHGGRVAFGFFPFFFFFFALFLHRARGGMRGRAGGKEHTALGGGHSALSTSPGLLFNLGRGTGRSQLYFCPILYYYYYYYSPPIPPAPCSCPSGPNGAELFRVDFRSSAGIPASSPLCQPAPAFGVSFGWSLASRHRPFLGVELRGEGKGRESKREKGKKKKKEKKAVSLQLAFLGKGSFPGDCPDKRS